MKFILSTVLILTGLQAWASGEGVFDRGNGGDVVVCTNHKGETTYELLDLYELKQTGFALWSEAEAPSSAALLEKILNRMALRHPGFVKALRVELELFNRDVTFVRGVLPNVEDEGGYSLEEGCELKQLAIQWAEASSFGRRYDISMALWEKLDAKNQAALVLHELMYRLLVQKSKWPESKTSVGFRAFVALFFSQEYEWAMGAIELPSDIWTN